VLLVRIKAMAQPTAAPLGAGLHQPASSDAAPAKSCLTAAAPSASDGNADAEKNLRGNLPPKKAQRARAVAQAARSKAKQLHDELVGDEEYTPFQLLPFELPLKAPVASLLPSTATLVLGDAPAETLLPPPPSVAGAFGDVEMTDANGPDEAATPVYPSLPAPHGRDATRSSALGALTKKALTPAHV